MSDEPLAQDTILVRAPDVRMTLGDDDLVRIHLASEDLLVNRVALNVLDAFTRPRRVADVLAALGAAGPEDFIQASSVIVQLVRAGVLGPAGSRPREIARGFVQPSIHIDMLNDTARTSAFCNALRALVTPHDVVVDIGTGTGVLATCAALAGARRVFAVESTGIADVAERVFAANGVGDRVAIVRQHSTKATLEERGTILVTETIGNDPLDEQILEIVSDARRRLLVPAARVIPSKLEIVAVAVDIPEPFFERHFFTPARVDRYRQLYGIDFEPLLSHRPGIEQPLSLDTVEASGWRPVAKTTPLATLDLEGEIETAFVRTARLEVTEETARLGVYLAFRATLAPTIVLSTVPGEVSMKNAWRYELWPAVEHAHVAPGTSIDVELTYRRGRSSLRFSRP